MGDEGDGIALDGVIAKVSVLDQKQAALNKRREAVFASYVGPLALDGQVGFGVWGLEFLGSRSWPQ